MRTTYYNHDEGAMEELFTSVTRKGQITLPAAIRRSLGIKEGDKVAVSLVTGSKGEEPKVMLKAVRSVAEMTFGAVTAAVTARKQPEDIKALRQAFEEGIAEQVIAETIEN